MNKYYVGFDGTTYLFHIKSNTYHWTVIPVRTSSDANAFTEILERNGYLEVTEPAK